MVWEITDLIACVLQDFSVDTVQDIANSIVRQANLLARDPDYMSPFALNAEANGLNVKGVYTWSVHVDILPLCKDSLCILMQCQGLF